MNCPICKKTKSDISYPYETFYRNKLFIFHKCNICQTVYLNQKMDEEDLVSMYRFDEYHNNFYREYDETVVSKNFIKLLNELKSKNFLRICDFGCGNGQLLNSVNLNAELHGVEYDSDYISILKKKFENIKFHDSNLFFNDRDLDNFFDFVLVGDVLEHLTDPYNFLLSIQKKIKKDGYLLIQGPIEESYNLIYYISKFFGYLKYNIGIKNNFVPYHIFRINNTTQKNFLMSFQSLSLINYFTYESGWPYKSNGFLRNFISNLNSLLIKQKNHFRNNRFICVLRKN